MALCQYNSIFDGKVKVATKRTKEYNGYMTNPFTWLSRRRFPYEPLISVKVSSSAIIHNLERFMAIAPKGRCAPVLKSDAYGHGLLDVAVILERYRNRHSDAKNAEHPGRMPFYCIDSYFEAVALRARGIRTPLVVIGYTRPETILGSHLRNVSFAIGSLDMLRHLEQTLRPVYIHLKLDTGMHRQGIVPEEVPTAIDLLAENNYIVLEGICSHFADADDPDPSFTESQIHSWNKSARLFRDGFPMLEHIHISATSGHRYAAETDATCSRLGLGLYGISDGSPFMDGLGLEPALEMTSVIAGIKKIRRDETVGYGGTFKADRDMVIATVPAGYYEGVDRRLSNVGSVLVGPNRHPCRIIGRVSMNMTTIDVTSVPGAAEGMEAVIVSRHASDPNSIQSIARLCGTIPYEIAVHIPAHLKRTVID